MVIDQRWRGNGRNEFIIITTTTTLIIIIIIKILTLHLMTIDAEKTAGTSSSSSPPPPPSTSSSSSYSHLMTIDAEETGRTSSPFLGIRVFSNIIACNKIFAFVIVILKLQDIFIKYTRLVIRIYQPGHRGTRRASSDTSLSPSRSTCPKTSALTTAPTLCPGSDPAHTWWWFHHQSCRSIFDQIYHVFNRSWSIM